MIDNEREEFLKRYVESLENSVISLKYHAELIDDILVEILVISERLNRRLEKCSEE